MMRLRIASIVCMAALGALLAGCATKEMKSTPFYEGDEVAYVGEASDRVNLWPVAYWRNPVGSVIWPVVSFSDDHFAFRPIYSQYKQKGCYGEWDEFNFVWPIVQVDTKNEDYRVFPVFWGNDSEAQPYQAVFPIYWNGAHYNTFVPLWYKGENSFVSLLYAQSEDEAGSWWTVPLGLSWGKGMKSEKSEEDVGMILLGLGAWESQKDTDGDERGFWWAFPFVHREWSAPADPERRRFTETNVAAYLSGWSTRDDELTALYAFPLFAWDEDGSWLTLLGGKLNSCGTTNVLVTPLVCMTSGKRTGGYVFPVWWHEKNADFDEKIALIDSPTLPDCIEVTNHTEDNRESEHFGKSYLGGESFFSSDETGVLLHDADHQVYGCDSGWYDQATNTYEITESCKRGNLLLLNYEAEREVSFDLKTKAKLSDGEESEASFLLFLYQYDWNRDRMNGDEYTRHRVLWRLWDWEERNGDVALDVFPGFTYDSRKDGYTKTSFWWRFFRYENDPKTGTSVDFLFIPVWR